MDYEAENLRLRQQVADANTTKNILRHELELTRNSGDMITTRLVLPKDLNPANRMFGGTMMSWLDEAGAMYAINKLDTNMLVTASVSKINFTNPAFQGDILEFRGRVAHVGTKSFTVAITVLARREGREGRYVTQVTTCEMVFVTVDKNGESIPHGYAEKRAL
jgi:uncharacterized protein (TIGR00369 family)